MFFLPSNATIPEPGNGTSQKTNPLGAVKQIIFVRHGEHAYLNDTDTPCMSDIGMARAVMIPRYLTRPDAPRGVVSFFLSAFLFGFFFLGKEKNSKTQKLKQISLTSSPRRLSTRWTATRKKTTLAQSGPLIAPSRT